MECATLTQEEGRHKQIEDIVCMGMCSLDMHSSNFKTAQTFGGVKPS